MLDELFEFLGDVVSSLFDSGGDVSEMPVSDMIEPGAAGGASGGDLQFGQTVQFPDGTNVENPHTDAQGYVYPTKDDWIGGTNKHVIK